MLYLNGLFPNIKKRIINVKHKKKKEKKVVNNVIPNSDEFSLTKHEMEYEKKKCKLNRMEKE